MTRSRLCLAAAALVLAGGARAATPDLTALNAAVLPPARSVPGDAPLAAARSFERVTMMKTAVARRLAPDGLTGSLGLLCGRQPNRDISGGAGAFDKDPEGKFLGAQLSRTF